MCPLPILMRMGKCTRTYNNRYHNDIVTLRVHREGYSMKLERYMKPQNNMRIDFNMKLLLATAPCEYRMVSIPSEVEGSSRVIVASVGIKCHAGNVVVNVTPWMHGDMSSVSLFYRRQNEKQAQLIRRFKTILEHYSIPYQIRILGK